MTRRASFLPRFLSGLGVALVAVVLALPLVEVAVRALGLGPDVKLIDLTSDDTVYRRSTNPILGFELKADYRDPDADLVMSYPATNAHGQRDVERALAKLPGVTRILVLGASVVEGFGIRDVEDMITRRLERRYADGRTEVLNFGVSAYCTLAKVELLRVKGLRFAPDVVVLVFTENDFNNFNHEAFPLGSPVERPALAERLFAWSHAFRLASTRLNWFYYGAQADPVAWNREAIGDDNVVVGFRRLAELAERHGFEPVIGIWPLFSDRDIVDPYPMPGRPAELIVERLARAHGLPSFRFSRAFLRERAAAESAAAGEAVNPRQRYTLGDRLHPNAEGCRIAADALERELADALRRRRNGVAWSRLPGAAGTDAAAEAAARVLGEKDPQVGRIVVNLGNTLLSQGRVDEAIEQYRRALAMRDDFAEAHNNLGIALKTRGELDAAAHHYREALRIDPTLADAHNNLGVVLVRAGRLDEGIDHFRRALALRPGFGNARLNLESALAHRARGQ